MTLGDVIAKHRKDNNMSMDAFAEVSGISKGYISMLERNKTQRGEEPTPSVEMYKSVAKVVGVDVDALIRMVDGNIALTPSLPPNIHPLRKVHYVPRIGRIACGTPILAEENIQGHVLLPDGVKADFALDCTGDSMIEACIGDGDTVFIRAQPEVENGEIAAVLIGEEATLKRIYLNGNVLTLMPANKEHMPLSFTRDEMASVRILGKAMAVLKML